MLSKDELKRQPEYWIEVIQNNIFRVLHDYMKREKLNQSQLASRMGVSKGYISQILNGNFNFSLSKLVELSIFLGMYPDLNFIPFESKAPGKVSNRINRNSPSKRKVIFT